MIRSASPPGERLSRHHKLRRRADFLRCYRRGGKRRGSLATLHFHTNEQREVRLGITASRKVGKAVLRHRVKRRVREIFRRFPGRRELAAIDIVVHLWPEAGSADFPTLRNEIERLLASLRHPMGRRPRRPKPGESR